MIRFLRRNINSHRPETIQGSLLVAKELLEQAQFLFQHEASDVEMLEKISTAILNIDKLS